MKGSNSNPGQKTSSEAEKDPSMPATTTPSTEVPPGECWCYCAGCESGVGYQHCHGELCRIVLR